jgi:hypothetical protein
LREHLDFLSLLTLMPCATPANRKDEDKNWPGD